MSTINLAQQGIFPIIYDEQGKKLTDLPETDYQIAGTLQGEGKMLGMPCLFVRTSGCNLRCAWVGADGNGSPCDTPYTSWNSETNKTEINDIVETIKWNAGRNISHVIVSGGEPTLQAKKLAELLQKLQSIGFHTTIETNGTLFNEDVALYTDLISMSPKLSSSTPWEANLKKTGIEYSEKWAKIHEKKRRNLKAFQNYINVCYEWTNADGIPYGDGLREDSDVITQLIRDDKSAHANYSKRLAYRDFQLKFVVSSLEDIKEIEDDFLAHLKGVFPQDICLMPEGVTPEDLMAKSNWVAEEAIKRGWRFTPRLHALLWGIKQGV